jgi:DNA-binding transcriptional ArsR family regulator
MLSSARRRPAGHGPKRSPEAQAGARPRRRSRRPDPVFAVRDAGTLQALAHPLRVQVLEALREPAAAATVARRIGQPRQKVNYHLKELERAGLVQRVAERRVGNFVESVYRAVARSFVVSPEVTWGDGRRSEALQSQHSLETLVLLGEGLQQDAAALLDRAAFEGEQIASASVAADVHFADEAEREAFLNDYLRATAELLKQYGKREGAPYRVLLAAYPQAGQEPGGEGS